MNSIGTPDWSQLPVPEDDGATRHLPGAKWPELPLESTRGEQVDLSKAPGCSVVFAYPRTGQPGVENPLGWDLIPGARGCTPQSCAFRDRFADLLAVGVDRVFGLSTQVTEYQQEAAERLQLPFAILSDADLKVTQTLQLPAFKVEGKIAGQPNGQNPAVLLKRLTLVVRDARIAHVFYPVFPPDANATEVLDWFKERNFRTRSEP